MNIDLKRLPVTATPTVSWKIDTHSPSARAAAALMGAFVFLRAVYYFGTDEITAWGAGALWLELILPGLLALSFIVLLQGLFHQESMVYGGLSGAFCLLLIIWGFRTWGGVWAVLGLLWYLVAGAALAGTVLGYLQEPLYLTGAFFIPVVLRLVLRDLGKYVFSLHLISFLPEASVLCLLSALGCLSLALRPLKLKK